MDSCLTFEVLAVELVREDGRHGGRVGVEKRGERGKQRSGVGVFISEEHGSGELNWHGIVLGLRMASWGALFSKGIQSS